MFASRSRFPERLETPLDSGQAHTTHGRYGLSFPGRPSLPDLRRQSRRRPLLWQSETETKYFEWQRRPSCGRRPKALSLTPWLSRSRFPERPPLDSDSDGLKVGRTTKGPSPRCLPAPCSLPSPPPCSLPSLPPCPSSFRASCECERHLLRENGERRRPAVFCLFLFIYLPRAATWIESSFLRDCILL